VTLLADHLSYYHSAIVTSKTSLGNQIKEVKSNWANTSKELWVLPIARNILFRKVLLLTALPVVPSTVCW